MKHNFILHLIIIPLGIMVYNIAFSQNQPVGIFDGHSDVGANVKPGSATFIRATGQYVVSGAGYNVWGDHDEFQYVWKKMKGDFILYTRAEFLGNWVTYHRKVGWMVRKSLDGNSAHVNAVEHGDGLTSLQYRRTTAAQTEENVLVLRQSAATLREEVKIAEVRHQAGEISTADKSQIEITADRFELESKTAESSAAQARVALEVLMGQPHPKGNAILLDHLETLLMASPVPITNSAVVWRPDVVAAEAAFRKAEADVHLQKANRIPDPTVLAQYEHEPPDNPNSIGLGVSFPIPLWNRNRGNILAAEAARDQARIAYEKVKAQAVADIATAQLAYQDARTRWESYRDSIRPKSEQIRKTIAYAYEKGGASLLDLLSTQRNDNDVRLAAAQAQSDILVALAALKAATMEIQSTQFKK